MKHYSDIIPDKSHTFSKAHHQYPKGISPLTAKKAYGSKLVTNLGEYTDWSMGLGPVIKGYNFKPLNDHIIKRVRSGIAYSLPSDFEFDVAAKLLSAVNFGESVRFARNGSDVTSAAIRLSRYITKRELVICNGYHGWQDWFIGTTTRSGGVPESIKSLTKKIEGFDSNKLKEMFHSSGDKVACLIIEPMIGDEPNLEFLELARDLCNKHGSLLIFDECWTGFRCHKEGAIGYTGIRPDLVCYAKAIGNGVPVSAILGPKNYMHNFEEIFFSFTHASDPIGLAAADFMIDYLDHNFFDALTLKTKNFFSKIKLELNKIENPKYKINVTSYPGKIVLSPFEAKMAIQLKTFIQKEFLNENMLFNMFFAMCEDHDDKDIDLALNVIQNIVLKLNAEYFDLENEVKGQLVSPVFRPQK